MSNSGLLEFRSVSKQFKRTSTHDSLRDLLPSLLGRSRRTDAFWAVKDVSFSVRPGEVLGIIGHNGAGKSTILKLLNRIIEPTRGSIAAVGRIGSLIEVSAGFHQDLSGRQNVYLQGAIMGMRRAEIDRRFDEIVKFAELSEFIDTPVKRYSSGMNARLGFSIAAHFEPDVLIIDEVLAVGDHAFQVKAFSRLKQMATGGAPVVLVSHQLDRVAEICTKCILLDHGAVAHEGTPQECIEEYLAVRPGELEAGAADNGFSFGEFRNRGAGSVTSGDRIELEYWGRCDSLQPNNCMLALRVIAMQTGLHVYSVINTSFNLPFPTVGEFHHSVGLSMNVPEGSYLVKLAVWDPNTNSDVVRGPQLQVDVGTPRPFWGNAQLNGDWKAQ
ncbi:ABC transporter ATP-binding protein [Gemmatimonas sp.]|uniref:ABC transporter ATP-binding protein n=1 Tax=Gemmatimonas sp. TaxID=1962908 RepID=UPI003569D83F